MSKKVSIIIPIYNAEKYVEKCINSVINQTYKNIEILLINDGSKDNSLKIIKKYEKKYPKNIKVFSHTNHGLGYTRNVGLDNATGDYVTFLDSDDWFDLDYVEVLVNSIKDNDVVVSGFKRFNYKYEFQYEKKPVICSWSKYKYCSIAGKMYNKKFLDKEKLRYSKLKMGEDSYFNVGVYSKTKKTVVIDYAGYCNYENMSSMTKDVSYSFEKSFLYILQQITKNINTKNLEQNEFKFYIIKTLIIDIILYKNCLTSKDLISHYRESIIWYKKFLKSNDMKFSFYYQNGEEFKINFFVNVFILCTKLHLDGLLIRIIKRMDVSTI